MLRGRSRRIHRLRCGLGVVMGSLVRVVGRIGSRGRWGGVGLRRLCVRLGVYRRTVHPCGSGCGHRGSGGSAWSVADEPHERGDVDSDAEVLLELVDGHAGPIDSCMRFAYGRGVAEKRVTIQLRISPAAYEAVKKRAAEADKTIAETLRDMLRFAEQRMAR
jgi:hypothetical protein